MTHDNGAVPYGKRRQVSMAVKAIATSAPEQFKELATPFVPELVEILFADARDRQCIGHRTAVSALLDGLKITNSNADLLAAILARFRLPNEASLTAAAELYMAVQDQDEHEIARTCREYLKLYDGRHGSRKPLEGSEVEG